MNVILNLKKRCRSLWNRYQRKTLFVVDVSIDWATGRRWQTKLVDICKVTQIHWLCQESVTAKQAFLRTSIRFCFSAYAHNICLHHYVSCQYSVLRYCNYLVHAICTNKTDQLISWQNNSNLYFPTNTEIIYQTSAWHKMPNKSNFLIKES